MLPRVAGWSFASELWAEFFYAVVATLAYPVYFAWMLWSAPIALGVVLVIASVVNVSLSLFALWVISHVCERIPSPHRLLGAAQRFEARLDVRPAAPIDPRPAARPGD